MKSKVKALVASASAVGFMAMINVQSAFAASGINDAFGKAGIKDTGNMDGLYDDLNKVVTFIITIGAFWAIAWLIVAGMQLAGSAGNPQKRNTGIVALGMVLVGLFIIYKAYDIAGWATGIGS